jgi:alpha-glucosidase
MWWRDAVLYQVYLRSFADGNGDGHGDLVGLRSKLEYLEWLGVDAVWLTPIHPSPNHDWGYDVSDYYGVHPDYGTLDDLDALVLEAERRGLKVLLDLVPNHTSDEHPWFADSQRPDWYVWADEPNNWASVFGGSAWTFDERVGKHFLHNFLPEQPDLDWWNAEVRAEFERILRFWFDRGIAGFRIDVAHGLVKDHLLRDDPDPKTRRMAMHQKEVHEIYRRWRVLADEYDPLLLGETWVEDLDDLARYYGDDDELQLAMNFRFVEADLDAAELRAVVEASVNAFPAEAWPVWCSSNHDIARFPTRWCMGDESKIRCGLLVLLGLRGTPILYYGDELGMEQVAIPKGEQLDRAHLRDGARTPMPWSSTPEREWWIRHGDLTRNVADMRADPTSTVWFTRELIDVRRALPPTMASIDAPDGVWAWRRGESAAVALNLSARTATVDGIQGAIRLDTQGARRGENVAGALKLAPWEGVVVTS